MKTKLITAVIAAFCAGAASAGDFGSEQEAQDIAKMMSGIIQSDGLDAGIAAMHDTAKPFTTSTLGIHLFEDGIIVGDNREPELLAASYMEVEDLTGDPMWPRSVAAADAKTDAILEWYHYDTESEYSYACYSEWAIEGSAIVMVCR